MILSLKTRVLKYEDADSKDKVVIELRKDFTDYKNIFIKKVTKLEEYENDSSILVISKLSLFMLIIFIVFVLIGVFR